MDSYRCFACNSEYVSEKFLDHCPECGAPANWSPADPLKTETTLVLDVGPGLTVLIFFTLLLLFLKSLL